MGKAQGKIAGPLTGNGGMASLMAREETTPLGTAPAKRKYAKEELRGDVQWLSQRVMTWLLEGDRLERMLCETKLKDIAVVMGITTEKLLLLEGQPTQIVSQQQQTTMDQALPLLLAEMQRRGVKTEVRERSVTITQPESSA